MKCVYGDTHQVSKRKYFAFIFGEGERKKFENDDPKPEVCVSVGEKNMLHRVERPQIEKNRGFVLWKKGESMSTYAFKLIA